MRLTVLTDYSLRVLMYLGTRPDQLATIDEIARAYGISGNHLMKVVNGLAREGFVETVRGRGGGLRLARAPEAITVGSVVRVMEDDMALVECFREDNTCRIAGACLLRQALNEALNAYLTILDGWTLADLVARPKRLLAELQLNS